MRGTHIEYTKCSALMPLLQHLSQVFEGDSVLCHFVLNSFTHHFWKKRARDFELKCEIGTTEIFQLVPKASMPPRLKARITLFIATQSASVRPELSITSNFAFFAIAEI